MVDHQEVFINRAFELLMASNFPKPEGITCSEEEWYAGMHQTLVDMSNICDGTTQLIIKACAEVVFRRMEIRKNATAVSE